MGNERYTNFTVSIPSLIVADVFFDVFVIITPLDKHIPTRHKGIRNYER